MSAEARATHFPENYADAVSQIVDFCEAAGVALRDRTIADIGCGDGAMTLLLANAAQPARLVGFDIVLKTGDLAERAASSGIPMPAAERLQFVDSSPTQIPAPDDTFDVVTTWSAFEHIRDPLRLLSEIRRVLTPHGVLFLQLWPFYQSERGSHLWEWFPDGFHHLTDPGDAEILERMRASGRHVDWWTEYMAAEFLTLNRITVEELNRCILAAGLRVTKLELLTQAVHIPPELSRHALTDLGIGGIKLLAVPAP